MIPLPVFPVDSASNCSSQAPRSKIPGEATIVSLSRPSFAATPRVVPRITPADTRNAHGDLAELVGFGDLLHFGAGISDGDEAIAGFLLADLRFNAIEEILFVNVRLESAAGFAGHDADGALEVNCRFHGLDLRRVRGIENMQLGITRDLSERHSQNFGAEARAAH